MAPTTGKLTKLRRLQDRGNNNQSHQTSVVFEDNIPGTVANTGGQITVHLPAIQVNQTESYRVKEIRPNRISQGQRIKIKQNLEGSKKLDHTESHRVKKISQTESHRVKEIN